MRRFKILSSLLAGALAIWVASCSKGPVNVNVAKVVSIEGTVMIQKAEGSTPIKAFLGSELLPDYVIRTVGEGRAKVQIGERAVISVEPSSSMKIRDLFKDPVTGQENTRVEFTSGKSKVNITRKLASQDSFDVMTPSAVAGVRGTEFLIDVEDPAGSKIAVTTGSVVVRTRIAALDDSKKDAMPVAVKEALKELAESQEVPVRGNQEVAIDKKEAEKKNEIINQVVLVATEKMKDVMRKSDVPKESKVEVIKSALSSIIQDSQKKIEVSAQNNEFKKTEVAELSAETKAKAESIEAYTPVPIEELKSLKNKKVDSVKDFKQVVKSEEKPANVKPDPKTETVTAETKKPDTEATKTETPVAKEATGNLSLSIVTEGAIVSAIGANGEEPHLKAGDNVLKPGKYTIKADRQGYKYAESSILVESGKTVVHRIELLKKQVVSEKNILIEGKTIVGKGGEIERQGSHH